MDDKHTGMEKGRSFLRARDKAQVDEERLSP